MSRFAQGGRVMRQWMDELEGRLLMSTSSFYVRTDLVSDDGSGGTRADANLVNGWGLASSTTGPWWVSSAEKGLVPAYDGTGAEAAPAFAIPHAAGQTESNPTGIVFNDSSNAFGIDSGSGRVAAEYVVATENGTIAAWNPDVDPLNATLEVDRSADGAIYKGIAIGKRGKSKFLYATDFHNGRIDVFSAKFKPVAMSSSAFVDDHLPAGYAPFNIANLDGKLYVTYALQDADAADDVGGPRHGFVDVFQADGTLVKRFASRGTLNSPWGMVVAPHSFGKFADHILIGNFGNGQISVFSRKGKFVGFVNDDAGDPIVVDGLWGLAFGNGSGSGAANTLFFASGPDDESHGLFGSITPGKSHHHGTTTSSATGGGGGGGFGY